MEKIEKKIVCQFLAPKLITIFIYLPSIFKTLHCEMNPTDFGGRNRTTGFSVPKN